jgi:hypothetical protein
VMAVDYEVEFADDLYRVDLIRRTTIAWRS